MKINIEEAHFCESYYSAHNHQDELKPKFYSDAVYFGLHWEDVGAMLMMDTL